MLFLFHIALLLHGAFGLLVAKVRLSVVYEMLPDKVLSLLASLWPYNVYPVERTSPEAVEPSANRAYAISAAEIAYSVYYLHSKHGKASRRG